MSQTSPFFPIPMNPSGPYVTEWRALPNDLQIPYINELGETSTDIFEHAKIINHPIPLISRLSLHALLRYTRHTTTIQSNAENNTEQYASIGRNMYCMPLTMFRKRYLDIRWSKFDFLKFLNIYIRHTSMYNYAYFVDRQYLTD